VILVEIDDAVAAVWQTLLQKEEGLWLAQQIGAFNLTLGNVEALLSSPTPTTHEKAFQTLVRNRVNRGGILAPGAGKIKYGENGKGITSRWYPKTLQKRILDIVAINDRLTFIYGDGFSVLAQNAHRIDVVFFIDPPYTVGGKKAGSRLYTHADMDHLELFRMAQTLTGDFLMTYDNTQEASDLARQHGFDTQAVAMKNTHHARLTELLIGRNLDWLR
jgi:DNA adenine methylase